MRIWAAGPYHVFSPSSKSPGPHVFLSWKLWGTVATKTRAGDVLLSFIDDEALLSIDSPNAKTAAASPAVESPVKSDGGQSLVDELLALSGTDKLLALEKFKANLSLLVSTPLGEQVKKYGYGNGPPTRSYRDLVHSSQLFLIIDKLQAATSKENLKEIKGKCRKMPGPHYTCLLHCAH